MWKIRAAFANDDGKTFMRRHFGDARYFDIYDIDETAITYVMRIINTVEEEESVHADPVKAGGIAGLLKESKVNTAVSLVFGPNIMRIKKKFVCVRMDDSSIDAAVIRLQQNFLRVKEEWEKGEERSYLNLLTIKTELVRGGEEN